MYKYFWRSTMAGQFLIVNKCDIVSFFLTFLPGICLLTVFLSWHYRLLFSKDFQMDFNRNIFCGVRLGTLSTFTAKILVLHCSMIRDIKNSLRGFNSKIHTLQGSRVTQVRVLLITFSEIFKMVTEKLNDLKKA